MFGKIIGNRLFEYLLNFLQLQLQAFFVHNIRQQNPKLILQPAGHRISLAQTEHQLFGQFFQHQFMHADCLQRRKIINADTDNRYHVFTLADVFIIFIIDRHLNPVFKQIKVRQPGNRIIHTHCRHRFRNNPLTD